MWGHTSVTPAQGKQMEKDHRINANLGFIQFQATHTGVLYLTGILLLNTNFYIQSQKREMKLTFPLVPIQFQLSLIPWTRGTPFHEEDSKVGQRANQKSLGKTEFRESGPIPSSSVSWRVSLCLRFYHIASLYFISLMRSFPFGFHFVIEQLNYNVTSNFAVQSEGGKKQNGFSQWDASQQLKFKNSHTFAFRVVNLRCTSFTKGLFFVL